MISGLNTPGSVTLRLLEKVICPHCWAEFAPEDAVWIATHASLYGDEKLGESELRRFLPSRFTPDSAAAHGDEVELGDWDAP